MKILILKPSSLGDVIHALPVLRLLKRHWPHSEIHWWIEESLAALLEDDPDLTGLLRFTRRNWFRPHRLLRIWKDIRHMRGQRFDYAIDLQGLSRSALTAWLANSQTIIGLDNPREGRREGAQSCYDILAPRSPKGTQAPERYLSVLSVLGMPVHWDFEWLPQRPTIAARVREKAQNHSGSWIMLVPGARWETKRWPVENFAETVRILSRDVRGLKFAILGSAADRPLSEKIASAAPDRCLDLTGRTSLPEMIEWLRLSNLVITNDTGPMHVAAALGKPLLALFGPSDSDSTGPYAQSHHVIRARHLSCVPCMKAICHYHEPLACLRWISPEVVAARGLELLASRAE